jgi:hypothetical protein
MLHGWENFFIVGATAGATLIGLLFVALNPRHTNDDDEGEA